MNDAAKNGKRKIFLVVNPNSGSYHKEGFQKSVIEIFNKSQSYPEIYYMDKIEDLDQRINKALDTGFDTFVAAGGDGTIALLANVLRGKGTMGIIPIGTGNAIARVLNIPFSLEEALQVIMSSPVVRPMDGMDINGRLFLMSMSIGFTSSLMRDIDTKQKSSFGRLAYLFAGVRRFFLSDNKSHLFDIDIDGNRMHIKAAEVIVINAAPWGIPKFKIPGNRFDDGKAEICIVHRGRLRDIINAALDIVIRERKATLRYIGQGKNIKIDCTIPLAVQADGDIITKTPVTIKIIPHAVRILLPETMKLNNRSVK